MDPCRFLASMSVEVLLTSPMQHRVHEWASLKVLVKELVACDYDGDLVISEVPWILLIHFLVTQSACFISFPDSMMHCTHQAVKLIP